MDRKHKITDHTLADESLKQSAAAWKPEQWTLQCPLLSQSQLALLAPLAAPDSNDRSWNEKLHQLFLHLTSSESAAVFGKTLNSMQLIEIMHFIKNTRNDVENRQKLSSLFIGISPSVFREVITQGPEDTLFFLREEAMTKALQHHLSLITHELNTQFTDFCDTLSNKENELETINLQDLGKEEIISLYRSLENFHEEAKSILNLTGRVLGIAWNTNRSDLIQELGRIKELCQKYQIEAVGKEANHDMPASGLWLFLQKKIENLFSDQGINGTESSMKDSTPALEALVKFSVWHIEDYLALGLLPQAKGWNPLNWTHKNESLKNREQLFIEAENNLAKIGLQTLSDLKAERIYSKKALMEYINAHQRELLH